MSRGISRCGLIDYLKEERRGQELLDDEMIAWKERRAKETIPRGHKSESVLLPLYASMHY